MKDKKYTISVLVYNCNQVDNWSDFIDSLRNQQLEELEYVFLFKAENSPGYSDIEKLSVKDGRFSAEIYTEDTLWQNLLTATKKAKGSHINYINAQVCINRDYYSNVYNALTKNPEATIKARVNYICPDNRVMRTTLNATLSEGIFKETPLQSIFTSERISTLFQKERILQMSADGDDLAPEKAFLSKYFSDFSPDNLIFVQESVCRVWLSKEYNHFPGKFKEVVAQKINDNNIKHIDVCTVTDNGYAVQATVMMTSLKANKADKTHITMHVVAYAVDSFWLDKMLELNDSSFEVKIYERNPAKFIKAGIPYVRHVPPFNLIRFDLCEVLSHLDVVLYMDGDILIKQDISSLFDIQLGDNYIAAVRDLSGERHGKLAEKMGAQYYINSGVMLMNLKLMRKDDVPSQLLHWRLNRRPEWKLQDQDVFNYVCRNRVISLHLRYNNQLAFLALYHKLDNVNSFFGTNYSSYAEMMDDVAILHLCAINGRRPWQVTNGVFGDIWQRYLAMSPLSEIEIIRGIWLPNEYKDVSSSLASIQEVTKWLTVATNLSYLKLKLLRYRFLEKISFGKKREKYNIKKRAIREVINNICTKKKSL